MDKVRLDKYLWSIRLFKSRGLAVEAIDKGRVKMDSVPLKASKTVKEGEVYEVKTDAKRWVIKVLKVIEKRVAYSEAVLCYEDQTPPEEMERIAFQAASFHTGKRLSKVGRPTKKNLRDIQNFMDGEKE